MTGNPASSHGASASSAATSGYLLPVAHTAAVTVDTTTYADPVTPGSKLTTLVFGDDQVALAVALLGDAFPRWLLLGSAHDGLYMGDGTFDPYASGANIGSSNDGTGEVVTTSEVRLSAARIANEAPRLGQVSPKFTITSGALPTVALVSGTGAQILTTRDAETITPCTFNPGAATTATVTVALSPDNVTYSTLGVETVPAGVALDGTIHLVKVRVPAGWYLKLTVNAQAVLGTTTYY